MRKKRNPQCRLNFAVIPIPYAKSYREYLSGWMLTRSSLILLWMI